MKEEQVAIMEAEEINSEDSYFGARETPKDTFSNRRFFQAGFERGYKAAMKNVKGTEPIKRKIIDRKFVILAVNPCTGKTYTEADGFFVCAHDLTAPAGIDGMIAEGIKIGVSETHIISLGMLKDRVSFRQSSGDKKIPDTETDCEIDRCVGGKNL